MNEIVLFFEFTKKVSESIAAVTINLR